MSDGGTWRASVTAILAGMALWTAIAWLGGRAEPWDSGLYWTVGYPLSLILAAGFGYLFPRHPWRWALLLFHSQLVVMLASGAGLGLLPLGLILLTILSLPACAVARIGARARLRHA